MTYYVRHAGNWRGRRGRKSVLRREGGGFLFACEKPGRLVVYCSPDLAKDDIFPTLDELIEAAGGNDVRLHFRDCPTPQTVMMPKLVDGKCKSVPEVVTVIADIEPVPFECRARFGGKCRVCKGCITAGAIILWHSAVGAMHLECRDPKPTVEA